MVTSFRRSRARTAALSAPDLQQATAHPQLRPRLLDTHRQAWVSLLWGHCSFLLCHDVYKILFVPSRSLFPESCVSSVIQSYWPPKSNSLGVLSPLPDSQVGKSVVGPRTLLTVREFLWYNCSSVCGLSARWLYGGLMVTSSKRLMPQAF